VVCSGCGYSDAEVTEFFDSGAPAKWICYRCGETGEYDEPVCRGCGKPLDPENYRLADGCPCNSARGVNHGLVPAKICTCEACDPEQAGSSRAIERPGVKFPDPIPAAKNTRSESTKITVAKAGTYLVTWSEGDEFKQETRYLETGESVTVEPGEMASVSMLMNEKKRRPLLQAEGLIPMSLDEGGEGDEVPAVDVLPVKEITDKTCFCNNTGCVYVDEPGKNDAGEDSMSITAYACPFCIGGESRGRPMRSGVPVDRRQRVKRKLNLKEE